MGVTLVHYNEGKVNRINMKAKRLATRVVTLTPATGRAGASISPVAATGSLLMGPEPGARVTNVDYHLNFILGEIIRDLIIGKTPEIMMKTVIEQTLRHRATDAVFAPIITVHVQQ